MFGSGAEPRHLQDGRHPEPLRATLSLPNFATRSAPHASISRSWAAGAERIWDT